MADDNTRLLVRLEATISQFERQMKKATATSTTTARKIERDFKRTSTSLNNVGLGLTRSILGPLAALASAREIGQAADAFTRIQNALKVAGLEGDAAAAVFDRLFDAAQKNAAPIESLVQLYSRAALVQKELGVSTEELLRFTEGVSAALRVSGKSAAESSGALLQLSQALGSGIVRAEEFNSLLEGALPIAQAAARGLKEAGGSVAKLRTLIVNGEVSSKAFYRAFEAGQGTLETLAETTEITLGGAMTRVRTSFIRLVGTFNDTTKASEVVTGALDGIASAMDRLPGLVQAFRHKLEDLNKSNAFLDFLIVTQDEAAAFKQSLQEMQEAAASGEAAAGIEEVAASLEAARERLDELRAGMSADDFVQSPLVATVQEQVAQLEAKLQAITERPWVIQVQLRRQAEDASMAALAALDPKTVSVKDPELKLPDDDDDKGNKAKTPAQKFADDIARIRERTKALEIETSMVGASTYARERALAVLDLESEARRAGIIDIEAHRSAIEKEAETYANAVAGMERAEEAQAALIEAVDQFRDIADSAASTFISEIREGASAADALKASLDKVLDSIINIALQSAISGLFGKPGTTGGGFLSGFFGGGRAQGGPVSPGKAYLVGEKRPELFVPSVAGRIEPRVGGAAQGVHVTVGVATDGNGNLLPFVQSVAQMTTAQGISANNRRLPGMLDERSRRTG